MSAISKINPRFITKLFDTLEFDRKERELFADAFEAVRETFRAAIWIDSVGKSGSVQHTSWLPNWVTLLSRDEVATLRSDHDAGELYLFDPSSAFCAAATLAISSQPQFIVDVCSSPGGKGIFAWRAFKPNDLLCNETIGKRVPALISNLKRCKVSPVSVTSLDPRILAERIPGCSELVLVDAPCSGQSLVIKGEGELGAFHPSTINRNANRQKRIMATSARIVAPGGYIAYMTCTFSKQENEDVVEWFTKKFPNFAPQEIPSHSAYRSKLSDLPCYRLWPWQGGAGGFVALFKNEDDVDLRQEYAENSLPIAWRAS